MIITTYYSRLKDIPSGYLKLSVSRYLPSDLKKVVDGHILRLAPSQGLLNEYKNTDMNFEDMKMKFTKELENFKSQSTLREIAETDENIALICYEKDSFSCHRSIISEILINEFNVKVKEL